MKIDEDFEKNQRQKAISPKLGISIQKRLDDKPKI